MGFREAAAKGRALAADLTGGLILGVGIALAGACPGTTLAQIGAGYRDAIFTLAGGLCGAVAFSYAQPALDPVFLSRGGGKIIFTDLVGIPYWAGADLGRGLRCNSRCARTLAALAKELGGDVDGNLGQSGPVTPIGARVAPAE